MVRSFCIVLVSFVQELSKGEIVRPKLCQAAKTWLAIASMADGVNQVRSELYQIVRKELLF